MNSPQVELSENELSPQSLPLDQRTYPFSRNGVKDQVSALNKLWADLNHEWIPYRPPPHSQELSVTGAAKTWCERSLFILDDLDFLLSLPHHKVIYSSHRLIYFGAYMIKHPGYSASPQL